jgi:hypothetical protein
MSISSDRAFTGAYVQMFGRDQTRPTTPPDCATRIEPTDRSTDQPTGQPTTPNEATDRSTDRPTDHPPNEATDRSTDQPINRPANSIQQPMLNCHENLIPISNKQTKKNKKTTLKR